MSAKKIPVRIFNAVSGPGYTSSRRASEYVRQGRARFVRGGIEFIAKDPRHSMVRLVECAYDQAAHSGMATLESLRNLPVVGRADILLIRRSRKAA